MKAVSQRSCSIMYQVYSQAYPRYHLVNYNLTERSLYGGGGGGAVLLFGSHLLVVILATLIQRRQQELVPCLSCLHVAGPVHRLHGGRQRVLLLHGAGACRPARGHSSQRHFRWFDRLTDRQTDGERDMQKDR